MYTPQALIIDDNPNNVLVLQQLLSLDQIASVTLSTANNLPAELDELSDIDIVFLDLEMPGMNGYDALSVIKTHPNFATAKVVAYSVHISELHTVSEIGFDGFFGKPLDAESFSEQLRRIMQGEKIWYIP